MCPSIYIIALLGHAGKAIRKYIFGGPGERAVVILAPDFLQLLSDTGCICMSAVVYCM